MHWPPATHNESRVRRSSLELSAAACRRRLSMSAPISLSGLMMRPIGRLLSDSSPLRHSQMTVRTSRPAIKRIAVPELPRSSSSVGACKPCSPTPSIDISVKLGCRMSTPSARIAASVARQSSPARKPLTSVRTFSNAAKHQCTMRYRLVAGYCDCSHR